MARAAPPGGVFRLQLFLLIVRIGGRGARVRRGARCCRCLPRRSLCLFAVRRSGCAGDDGVA